MLLLINNRDSYLKSINESLFQIKMENYDINESTNLFEYLDHHGFMLLLRALELKHCTRINIRPEDFSQYFHVSSLINILESKKQ